MGTHSVTEAKETVSPEVELLNQACLDLVAQIEQLKKENAQLQKMAERVNGSGERPGLWDNSR